MTSVRSVDAAAERRARRERLVLEHMETENRQEFDRTIKTFSYPRYELIPTGQVVDYSQGRPHPMDESRDATG
jgi:hypothetical protein